jgi:hypothetical protein
LPWPNSCAQQWLPNGTGSDGGKYPCHAFPAGSFRHLST